MWKALLDILGMKLKDFRRVGPNHGGSSYRTQKVFDTGVYGFGRPNSATKTTFSQIKKTFYCLQFKNATS